MFSFEPFTVTAFWWVLEETGTACHLLYATLKVCMTFYTPFRLTICLPAGLEVETWKEEKEKMRDFSSTVFHSQGGSFIVGTVVRSA